MPKKITSTTYMYDTFKKGTHLIYKDGEAVLNVVKGESGHYNISYANKTDIVSPFLYARYEFIEARQSVDKNYSVLGDS